MIVLRSPKGWTGPKFVDGLPTEGTWRSHQVPLAEVRTNPEHLAALESWLRSYQPEELFDETGALVPELAALPPKSHRRMSANPHTNGGLLLRDLVLPDFREYGVPVANPGYDLHGGHPGAGLVPAGRGDRQPHQLPHVRPGRGRLQPPGLGFRGHRPPVGRRGAGVRRPPGARGQGHGGAVRAPVPGLAGRLPVDGQARSVHQLRGLHPHHRFDVQPARQMAEEHQRHPLAPAHRLSQLPAVLARVAPGPQRLFAPGPRLHRPRRQQEGRGHPGLPPAGHQLPFIGGRPLLAQPPLRERDRGRQAAFAQLPDDGRGRPALHPGHRDLGLGVQRRGRPRRGHGLLRGHPHPGDPGRRRHPAPRPSPS